jgi:hypothetical protein
VLLDRVEIHTRREKNSSTNAQLQQTGSTQSIAYRKRNKTTTAGNINYLDLA